MDRETLRKLEMLNQLSLTQSEKDDVIAFFAARERELTTLDAIPTENVERMVHVMPIVNVMRADEAFQPFTVEELQKSAPDVDEDYWCVPRVVE